MPGTASGLAQSSSGPSRNVNKSMAPAPPSGGHGSAEGARPVILSSTNYPDITAGIVDIYDPSSITSEAELVENDIVPDYPMDSLPRHASTMSLPNPGSSTAPLHVQTSRASESSSNNPRTSNSVQSVIPVTSLSSSSGNIPSQAPVPVSTVTAHVPASEIPTQVYTVSHSNHSMSPPSVSLSNVNVSVTAAGPAGTNPRQIRTQDINVGVVSRIDHQRQSGNTLPDLVAHSQPPSSSHPIPSSQRPPMPPVDPRVVPHGHRHGDPRYRHHRDRRHGRSRHHSHRHSSSEGTEEPCKESCYKCLAVGTSFRWILVVLSLLGVCCVVTGIVLAALHAAGNSFLFLAIMFIGE